jgi:hypothetical protein
MGNLENWRTYAELASQEEDPARLMELADKLNQALEQELLKPEQLSRDVPAAKKAFLIPVD